MLNHDRPKAIFSLLIFLCLSTAGFSAQDPAPAGKAPALDSINTSLDRLGHPISVYKDEITLKFDGEFRYRLETRDDFSFNDGTYEDDAINLFRSRLGMKLDSKYLIFYAQMQDAESVSQSSLHQTASFMNRPDLYQLYSEIKSPSEKVPLSVKVGRQELAYGDHRYVGSFGWSNVARVFDAVKLMYTPFSWIKVDTFFSQVVDVNRKKADSARHHENFYGFYAALGPWKEQSLDSFLFVKHDRNQDLVGEQAGDRGELKQYTAGNRFKGKLGHLDYGIEWATQFGSRAQNEISAWSWHHETGYTFSKLWANPRLGAEYNYGSGDSNPTDGIVENFDNLYPTNHPFYGFMDLASLRNIHDVALSLKIQPWAKVKFEYGHHWLFLATNNSAWFNAGQGNIRAANSGASQTIGQESDLLATWEISKHLDFLIGYSYFHAGPFIQDTGTNDNANFFYVQTRVRV